MNELIYGIHTVESLLKNDPSRCLCLYILNGFVSKRLRLLFRLSKTFNIPVQYCNRHYLNNKAKSVVHQGIVAKVRKIRIFTEKDIINLLESSSKKSLFLVLDHVVDPRNLGACLRCAGAFGVDMVIASRRRSVGINSVVRKVSCGMADNIPFVRVTNLVRVLQLLKKYNTWIVGAVLQTDCTLLYQANFFKSRLAVVMGSEELGIKFLTRKYCDELISIPMIDLSTSLNVSVATGIFLFEILRQCSVHQTKCSH